VNEFLLLLYIFISPIVISISYSNENDIIHPIIGLQISIADILIVFVLLLWMIQITFEKKWKSLKWPSIPIFIFLGIMILSGLNALSIQQVVKEVVQMSLYLVFIYMLFLQRGSDKQFVTKVIITIIGSIIVNLIFSFYQCYIEKGSPYLIRGLFLNRNLLGGYFIFVIPLVYVLFIECNRIVWRCIFAIVLCLSLLLIFAPFAVFSLLIGLFTITYINNKKFLWIVWLICGFVIASVLFSTRQQNVWKDTFSIYEPGSINENHNRIQGLLYDLPRHEWIRKLLKKDKILLVRDDIFMSSIETKKRIGIRKYPELEDQKHIKQRYMEWQAALNMFVKQPLIGFGAGNYQNYIGNHYGILPKVNTMEPNSDNLYLVIASTTGLFGLSALIWILSYFYKSSLILVKKTDNSFTKIIGLWGVGSILSISIYAFFTSFFVVSLMFMFVLIVSIIQSNLSCINEKKPIEINTSNFSQQQKKFLNSGEKSNPLKNKCINHLKNLFFNTKILTMVIIIFLLFILIGSYKKVGKEIYLWFEAEDAKEIISPIEIIDDSEASNKKGIVSIGREVSSFGEAIYQFEMPSSESIQTWFRTYWTGGCSNSFKIDFDDRGQFVIGNDFAINQWHWIRGPKILLNNGEHNLIISSSERDSRLDKFLLTNDPYHIPRGFGNLFNLEYIFNENKVPSKLKSNDPKKWQIVNDEFRNSNKTFYLKKVDRLEYSVLDVNVRNKFIFGLSFKSLSRSEKIHIRFLFGTIDINNYYYIDLFESELSYGFVKDNKEKILITKKLDSILEPMITYSISLIRNDSDIEICLNNENLVNFKVDSICNIGNVGFGSKTGDIHFDDLIYMSNIKPGFGDNFFETEETGQYLKDPTKINWTHDISPWKKVSGLWEFRLNECLLGKSKVHNSFALMINGESFWNNYEIFYAVKIPETGSTGLCFYLQNPANYYRFEVAYLSDNECKIRLIKRQNDIEKVLDSCDIDLIPGMLYKLHVKILNNEIYGYLDAKELIRFRDNTFMHGKIGLYTTVNRSFVEFDDIFVRSIDSLKSDNLIEYKYFFDPRDRSSLDLCDWEISNDHYKVLREAYLRIEKPFMKDVRLKNKKFFNDVSTNISFRRPPIPTIKTNIILNDIKGKCAYRFEIGCEFIRLWKNDMIIKENEGKDQYNEITVKKELNRLELMIDKENCLIYNDDVSIDTKTLAFGFTGIPETNITIRKIIIKKL
jgi:hypothetical protein